MCEDYGEAWVGMAFVYTKVGSDGWSGIYIFFEESMDFRDVLPCACLVMVDKFCSCKLMYVRRFPELSILRSCLCILMN